MFTLLINLTLIEVLVLILGAIILGITVYFFIQSRKTLQDAIEAQGLTIFPSKPKKIQEELPHAEIHVRAHQPTTSQFNKTRNEIQELLMERKQKNLAVIQQEKMTVKR